MKIYDYDEIKKQRESKKLCNNANFLPFFDANNFVCNANLHTNSVPK